MKPKWMGSGWGEEGAKGGEDVGLQAFAGKVGEADVDVLGGFVDLRVAFQQLQEVAHRLR